MGGDKRSVSTDALETLGSIIDENAGRDAIHIAVEPMQAGQNLYKGDSVGILNGKAYSSILEHEGTLEYVGIVDPFLKDPESYNGVHVKNGEWFWMLLYPRTITSLRHVWSHPAFDEVVPEVATPDKEASEKWLRDFISHADCPNYDTVIAAALAEDGYVNLSIEDDYTGYENTGEYLHFNGLDAHGAIPSEFWDHVEIVTGKQIKNHASSFSCSC